MAVYDIEGNVISHELPFSGEKLVTFGDSITYMDGHTASGTGELIKGYQGWLRDIGLDVTNLGVDGAKLAIREGTQEDIVETVAKTDCSGYDYVMIAGGTNDYGGGGPRPIGEIAASNYDTSTVIGAMQTMIEKIYGDKKDIKLFFVTPLMRTDMTTANSLGNTLLDYCNAIKTAAAHYAVPVLDFQTMSGLNAANIGTLTKDGLHPKNAGYAYLAKKLQSFVQSL